MNRVHFPAGVALRCLTGVVLLGMLGCTDAGSEFVYTRREPAAGRRSPTTFRVRVKVDIGRGTITWLEDVSDSDGDLGRTIRTFKDCTIFDETNWDCSPTFVDGEGIVDHVQMRDGSLSHFYWKEHRDYKRTRRSFGIHF